MFLSKSKVLLAFILLIIKYVDDPGIIKSLKIFLTGYVKYVRDFPHAKDLQPENRFGNVGLEAFRKSESS